MADTPSPPRSALSPGSQDESAGRQGSELESTQRALREAQDRLQALSDLTRTYTYSMRWSQAQGAEIGWVSGGLERTFGLASGPVTEQTWLEIVPAEDHERVRTWFTEMLAGKVASCEHRLIGRDGVVHWVNHFLRPRPPEGDWIPLDGAVQDITEHRRIQDELADSVARFRALAENATHVVAEIDGNGRITFLNKAVQEILGFSPTQSQNGRMESLVAHQFIHPDDIDIDRMRRTFATTEPHTARMRFKRADGTWRWLEWSGRSFRTAQGTWRRVSTGRDVTEEIEIAQERVRYAQTLEEEVEKRTAALQAVNVELRTLQQRLIYAERLGVAEELAGKVAHAINNPLAALLGTVEMELEASSGNNQPLQRIRHLAQRIKAVISQTLALFREGTLKIAEEEPGRIAEEVLSEIEGRASTLGVRIHYKLANDMPLFLVDRTLLAAALVSLTENALEAMPDGGDLWIEVSALPQIHVVRFTIADCGPGIPEELHKKVFEPFFTTKSAGTGLGLAIAQGVIRGHEGRISIGARPGGGALVRVDVPCSRPEKPERSRGRAARTSEARRAGTPREHGPGNSSPPA
jgi:two-component system, sporulation sensor kinase A